MDHIYSYSKLMVEQTPINKLRAHMEEVKELVTVLKDINFLNFISNLSVSADNKKQLLTQICDKSGLNKFKYIFWVIVDFKDSQLFIKILEQYIYDCVHKLKQKNIIIYTAFKLGRPTILKLIKNIKGYLKSEINYKVIVDKNLIGGVVIKGDNFNINKSVDNVVNAMFNEGVIGGENV